MRLKIFDSDGKLLTIYSEGEHVMGRGSLLDCTDYRVSRAHALLIIDQKEAFLKSAHFNPCYYKSASSNNILIVKNKCKQQLHNNDKFGFLPDQCWYQVELVMDEEAKQIKDISSTTTFTPNTSISNDVSMDGENKRQSTDEETDSNNQLTKKMKVEDYTMTTIDDSFTFIVNEIPKDEEEQSDRSSNEDDEIEAKDNKNIEEQQAEAPTQLNTLNQVDLPNNQPSTSSDNNDNQQKRQRRERCWYGAECYRKNAQHHQEFSHPNDSDYASDPDDTRPVCSYGKMCYRHNKTHRQIYKHPIGPPPKNMLKRKKDKKTTTAKKPGKKAKDPEETPDDDYDYDDPFIDDGDSDEYVESSSDDDDDDTDWEDFEAIQENSDDVKRLVKEAKRFTKHPK